MYDAPGDFHVTTDQPKLRTVPWTIGFTAVLTLTMAVATMGQFALGALAPFIREDLGLSRTLLGALSTTLFTAGAMVSPFLGSLTDRLGGRRVLLLLFTFDAIAFAAMALAPSTFWLFVAVAGVGVVIAGSNPSTNVLIAHHLPRGSRGSVVGIKQSGVQVSSFVAGAAFPALATSIGWRLSLLTVTGAACLGLVVTPFLVPPDPAGPDKRDGSIAPLPPSVRWLLPYAFFMGAGIASITAYIVLYAHEVVGLRETVAGSLLAVIGGVGVIARIAWSRDAERRTTTSIPLAWLAGLSLLSTLVVLAAEHTSAVWLWVGAAAIGATGAAWNSVGMLAVIREAGRGGAGRASGLVVTAFYVGLLVMPVIFGAVVDATEQYEPGWFATAGCFGGAFVTSLIWAASTRRGIRTNQD